MTTAAQRLAALDAANQVRFDRAELRRLIGAGEVLASAALAEMPDCIRGCGVYQFLTFIPYIGNRRRPDTNRSSKAFVLLRRADCIQFGHKRLDQLTPGQLERLTRVVRDYEQSKHPAERGMT